MSAKSAAELARTNPELLRESQELMQRVLARAATDLEFRNKLLSQPRVAIAEHTGREVSASFDVRFVENTADATIVLPDFVDTSAELSEDELENVAGGIIWTVTIPIVTITIAVASEK